MNIMKRIPLTFPILVALAASSCSTYYNYMTTDIRKDLSAVRTVYAQADSAYLAGNTDNSPFFFRTDTLWTTGLVGEPFAKNFYDETRELNAFASANLGSASGNTMIAADESLEGNPLLAPEESVIKRFRWFYTTYTYKAVYRQITDLPVPVSEYLDEKEQDIFFRNAASPAGWNGVEMYYLLDDMNSRFAKWYVHCTFKASYDIIYSLASPDMCGRMENFAEENLEKILSSDEDVTPESLCSMLDRHFKTDTFTGLYTENENAADSLYSEKENAINDFEVTLISEIRLPGRLTRANAPAYNDGNPQWKIDGYRLLCGSLTLEASSRTANIWAFAVTFLLLAGILYLLRRRF